MAGGVSIPSAARQRRSSFAPRVGASRTRYAASGIPALAVCVLAACLLILWGASAGPRGTDQYQYVDDVQTLANGEPPYTNLRFVASWLRALERGEDALAFSHNGPPMHAVAALARVIGAWPAWVMTNVAGHLLVAACVLIIVRGFASVRLARVAAALYVLSPIALWQAMNALQETTLATMVALGLLGWAHRDRRWGPWLLAAVLLVGVATHPIFLIPAGLWPVWEIGRALTGSRESVETDAEGRAGRGPVPTGRRRTITVASMLGFLLVLVLVRAQAPTLFPTTFQPNLAAIIASAVPGESNMYWQLGDELPPIDAALLSAKVRTAVLRHVADARNLPFYAYINLALIALVALAFMARRPGPARDWIVPLGLLHGAYLGMAVLQQPHARLVQIVAPASFVAIALVAARFGRRGGGRTSGTAIALLLIGSMTLGAVYAGTIRRDALAEATALERLAADLAHLPPDARVAIVDILPHAAVAHALRPRAVLVARTGMMPEARILEAIATFKPDMLIAPRLFPGMRAEARATFAALEDFPDTVVLQVPVLETE